MSPEPTAYRAAVIGCSAGGLEALRRLLRPLPEAGGLPLF